MFIYQESGLDGCCQFFGRPGFGELGLIPAALECVYRVRMHWGVSGGAAGMLRHTPGVPRLPSACAHDTHTPELLESTLTRQILAYQKSGNFGFLDKNTSLYSEIS